MEKTIECIRCGQCLRECEYRGAIRPTDTGVAVDLDMCIACGHCAAVCPTDAMDNPKAPRGPLAGDYPDPEDMARYLRQPRSVRQFKDGPVPRETMLRLLDIGRYPQTAVNTQGITYLVVEGRERMKVLGELYCRTVLERVVDDPLRPLLPAIAKEQLETGRDIIFRSAPGLILALADGDSPHWRNNGRYSLTFISLLAPSLGVGTCWAGFFESLALDDGYRQVFMDHLGVPKGKIIAGALMAGLADVSYRRLVERAPLEVEWR